MSGSVLAVTLFKDISLKCQSERESNLGEVLIKPPNKKRFQKRKKR
jgi:hypothetical protein